MRVCVRAHACGNESVEARMRSSKRGKREEMRLGRNLEDLSRRIAGSPERERDECGCGCGCVCVRARVIERYDKVFRVFSCLL